MSANWSDTIFRCQQDAVNFKKCFFHNFIGENDHYEPVVAKRGRLVGLSVRPSLHNEFPEVLQTY